MATSAGRAFGFTSLPPAAWPVIAATIADGTALAAAGRRAAGPVINPDTLAHVGQVADAWVVVHETIRARRPAD